MKNRSCANFFRENASAYKVQGLAQQNSQHQVDRCRNEIGFERSEVRIGRVATNKRVRDIIEISADP